MEIPFSKISYHKETYIFLHQQITIITWHIFVSQSNSIIKWHRYIPITKLHIINSRYCWNYSLLSDPILWAITSKANYVCNSWWKRLITIDVFDLSYHKNIEYDFFFVSVMMISFHNLFFQKSQFLRTLKKFKWKKG